MNKLKIEKNSKGTYDITFPWKNEPSLRYVLETRLNEWIRFSEKQIAARYK